MNRILVIDILTNISYRYFYFGYLNLQEPLEELILLLQHVVITNIPLEGDEGFAHVDELKNILSQLINFYGECNTDEIKVVCNLGLFIKPHITLVNM